MKPFPPVRGYERPAWTLRRGVTLIEVLWACLLLMVLAIAAGSFISLSSGTLAVSRNERVALELCNSRLEELRSAGFDAIKPPSENYNVYYLVRSGDTWVRSLTDPGEVVQLGGWTYPISTRVQYVDLGGEGDSYDAVLATVEVRYRRNEPNRVSLWAYFTP